MQEHQTLPSLLGFLSPSGSPIRLNMALGGEAQTSDVQQRLPFFLVSDSDPLTRLFRARFETEAGSLVRSVFLLVQKDRYRQAASPLGRLANRDVEGFWQNAAEQLRDASPDLQPILLSAQNDANGKPLPFRSLFFCKREGVYFHPPCPRCGQELRLCQDDGWLVANRLQAYSTSLSRYLHCPQCREVGEEPEFYAYEPDAFDPPIVKDCLRLIQEWSHMAERGVSATEFPCLNCAQIETCSHSADQLKANVIPFAFYPFHLLAFETMTFHAPDFLCLASGGSREELRHRLIQLGEMGKVNHLEVELQGWSHPHESPFFFRDSPRYFLEVLYLKLAFLNEVARTAVFDRGGPGLVDLVGSLDRIWVKLPPQSRSLPHFWNFQVHFLDIFRGAPGVPAQLKLPPTYALHLMGVLWLTALLTNRNQDSSAIQQAIDGFYNDEMQRPDKSVDGTDAPHRSSPVFNPGNIFWNPEVLELFESWQNIWWDSLDLGWSLMRASCRMSADWSSEGFQAQLATLRDKVREELFSSSSRREPEPARDSEDARLAGILTNLLEKWAAPEAAPESPPDMLFSHREAARPAISELETLPLDLAEGIPEDWGPETVILSPSGTETKPAATAAGTVDHEVEAPATRAHPPAVDLGPEQTLVLTGKGKEMEEQESLPETIMLSPGSNAKAHSAAPPHPLHPPSAPDSAEAPKDLELKEDQEKHPSKEADELLMETVILSPRKDKD